MLSNEGKESEKKRKARKKRTQNERRRDVDFIFNGKQNIYTELTNIFVVAVVVQSSEIELNVFSLWI